MNSNEYDVSLVRPIVTSAVAEHPLRPRLEELLGAGVQVQLREMEPHPDKPAPENVDEAMFQAFVRDGQETISIVEFPGYMLIPPVLGRDIGSPVIDIGVLQRPVPQVRMAFTWPDTPDVANLDVILTQEQAEDLARSLTQAVEIVEDLDENDDE